MRNFHLIWPLVLATLGLATICTTPVHAFSYGLLVSGYLLMKIKWISFIDKCPRKAVFVVNLIWSCKTLKVFEDAVDQLSILGSIVPSQRKSKNTYQQIADEITDILTEQKKLESEFDESAISDTTRTIKQLTTDLIGKFLQQIASFIPRALFAVKIIAKLH